MFTGGRRKDYLFIIFFYKITYFSRVVGRKEGEWGKVMQYGKIKFGVGDVFEFFTV